LGKLTIIDHPLVAHKLSLLRDAATPSGQFRSLLHEVALLLGYEVLRDLPTETRSIRTPVGPAEGRFLKGKKLVLVPVLRAGHGLLDGLLELVPSARVGHIGIYRNEQSLAAVEYYCKLPPDISERAIILLDPMLATGNSAVAAIDRLKNGGGRDIRLLCLLAAPEGIARLHAAHPDVAIFTAAVDRQLNERGYIVPGLGDAGDRMYATKVRGERP
jgi:uracil phosphoribosyltransferase